MSEDLQVKIVGFRPEYATNFAELNYEWIKESYTIEEHDHDVLDHPIENVIDLGGQIFFALSGEEVAGTVALIRTGSDEFELAKMAVAPAFRGRGVGNSLLTECINFARAKRKSKIVLESNTKQVAAVALYRAFGFREIPLDPDSLFVRANIRMELDI
ncbi:MAG: GNAT family N-acetyltransferase [Acidobacteriota bacterium]